jgi:hypothetical protein
MKTTAILVPLALAVGLALPASVAAQSSARYEETGPAIAYSNGWLQEATMGWSGGTAVYAVWTWDLRATATFTFTGTGVSWIGYRGKYGGFVLVYVDGALVSMIDTWAATEQVSVPVYTINGLAPGTHTLKVELTGVRHPLALASETAVDAFDVTP